MMWGKTYRDGSSLGDEADDVEPELALGSQGDTTGDHEDNHSKFLAWVLNTERP